MGGEEPLEPGFASQIGQSPPESFQVFLAMGPLHEIIAVPVEGGQFRQGAQADEETRRRVIIKADPGQFPGQLDRLVLLERLEEGLQLAEVSVPRTPRPPGLDPRGLAQDAGEELRLGQDLGVDAVGEPRGPHRFVTLPGRHAKARSQSKNNKD